MKIKIHVPVEQYGFVEGEFESDKADEVAQIYGEMSAAFKPKAGLDAKEFNAFLDKQLMGEGNEPDNIELLSPEQNTIVQAIKRSMARIKARMERG